MQQFIQSHFYSLLRKEAGDEGSRLVVACLAAGVMQGLAVFSVLQGLEQMFEDEGIRFHTFLAFLVCLGIFYRLFRYVTERAALIALSGVMGWRMRIATKLRAVNQLEYSRLDKGAVQSALVDDRELVVEASRMLMAAAVNSVMIVVAFLKMLTVSFAGTVGVIAFLGLGLFIFLRLVRGVYVFMDAARRAETGFSSCLRDLQDGLRQLKQHKPKTTDLFAGQIIPWLDRVADARESTERGHGKGISFFAVFNLLTLGLVLFLMPGIMGIDASTTSTLLILSMFCLTPMISLVSFVPMLAKVEMSLHELSDLEVRLDEIAEPFEREGVEAVWQHPDPKVPVFESLHMQDVRFDYFDRQGLRLFGVHVESFTLNRGELVFIRGGNGSGKSTFMNVLAGLYPQQSGAVFLNGAPLTDLGMEAYRNIFTLLPSDFHLFTRPLGVDASARRMKKVLELMRIDSKVRLEPDGSFSTLDLSAGQRKRLALACSLLEDRDVYLLDEVAADFDPGFRKFFYEELLPDLKREGCTILAISHDDRYFHVADRVLSMRDGIFVENGHDGDRA
jgi:putative ATP-binding cassette transporter